MIMYNKTQTKQYRIAFLIIDDATKQSFRYHKLSRKDINSVQLLQNLNVQNQILMIHKLKKSKIKLIMQNQDLKDLLIPIMKKLKNYIKEQKYYKKKLMQNLKLMMKTKLYEMKTMKKKRLRLRLNLIILRVSSIWYLQ